jgi:hypothetical protein
MLVFLSVSVLTATGIVVFNGACLLTPTVIFLGYSATTTFLLERCINLYSAFVVTQESKGFAESRFGIGSGDESEENPSTLRIWVWKNRKYFTDELFSLPKLVVLCVTLLLWLLQLKLCVEIFPAFLTSRFFDEECQTANYFSWLFIYPLFSMSNFGILWISQRMSYIHENFFIVKELKITYYIIIVYFFIFAISFVSPLKNYGTSVFYVGNGFIVPTASWAISCSFLIYRRMENSSAQGTTSSTSTSPHPVIDMAVNTLESSEDLKRILQDDSKEFQDFEAFLCKELCVENAYFYKAVEKLKDLQGYQFDDWSLRIHKEFISLEGSFTLELTEHSREKVEKVFYSDSVNQGSEDYRRDCLLALERVQSEIFLLIYKGAFIRYQAYKMGKSHS